MTPTRFLALLTTVTLVGACAHRGKGASPAGDAPKITAKAKKAVAEVTDTRKSETLARFKSSKELGRYLEQNRGKFRDGFAQQPENEEVSAMPMADPASAPASKSKVAAKSAVASEDDGDSITNTQEQGVDEGGIVKTHGDHLVVLRRGRLFTVDLGRKSMRPISAVSVSPEPGHDGWYDEMLIHDDTIVIVGFSYQANATEIGLFDINDAGQLRHRDTFFLRSNDYYSSRNYASRLLGDKLVFYMPYALGGSFDERSPNLPGVMPWNKGQTRFDDWDTIVDATEIYRPIQETDSPVLHTVVTCDLGRRDVHCDAKGIIGPYGRSFYVSQNAVYVWVHDGAGGAAAADKTPPGAVYRFPLDGGDPGALRVWGAPIDQFSFKESSDGFLNVVVMADSAGDQMWGSEFANQDVAMMRVPTAAMMHGVHTVNASAYFDLPEPTGNGYAFQNRFIGDKLLYGRGSGWGGPSQGDASLNVFSVSRREQPTRVLLPHGVDRIEAMGDAAVVVGTDGRNLHFTSLDLHRGASVAGEFVQPNAAQGELRSHGFFFKPSAPGDGTLGLPIRRSGAPGYEHLVHGSAEIMFLDVQDLNFRRLGTLASDPNAGQDDKCEVSCVDWYGNARPIFYKGRVFALLGYELVEGTLGRGGIREVDRVNMLGLINGRRRGVIWKNL
ncbi:MAG: beta-propeller domain-containing protein [Nannocystaceae bacterium]|nr:beta-propeller domain-containing protein [Nannocystaceae bacterium]